jgi:type II secretory pathway pseudopilin PulG
LIELLVVIAIISLLSTVVMSNLARARQKSRDAKRTQDMRAIQTALELYYTTNNGYPTTGGAWRSECNVWGGLAPNNVIPGLVPNYLGRMPSAPTMNKTTSRDCYLYRSNITDYVLLDHNALPGEISYAAYPSFIDPTRDGGANPCLVDNTNIWSWKISSSAVSRCW